MNSPMDDALGGYNWQEAMRSDHEKTMGEQNVDKKSELINNILKQNIADMEALNKMGLDPVVVAHGLIALQMDVANKIRDLLHGDYKIGGTFTTGTKTSESVQPTPPTYKNFSVIGDIDKFHNVITIKCDKIFPDAVDEIALAERLREALKHSDDK